MTTRAVIYAAKSTQDKHGSIGTQVTDCREKADREGWILDGEYEDESKSGYSSSRGDGLAQAREHAARVAAAEGACVLVVQHTDRLARGDGVGADHLIDVAKWARKAGVSIRSVQDDSTCENMIMAVVMGERNHEDSRRKGLAVKDGLKRRVIDRRQYIGGRRPYGYEWANQYENGTPLTTGDGRIVKQLEPLLHEAAVIRRIFDEYLAGRAQNAIAQRLEREGVSTLTPSGAWYATTIAGMLRNPLYVGMVAHNGEHYEGEHEPLISRDVWGKTCELRQARHSAGRPRGRRTAGRHALTEGLLICPLCAAAMSPVTKRDRRSADGMGYETYVCVKRLHHGPHACAQKPIKRDAVDQAVWGMFEADVLDRDATRDLLVKQVEREFGTTDDLHQAEGELARAEARLDKITRGWQDEVIDDTEYKRQREETLAERDAAQAQVEQHRRQQEAAVAMIEEFDADVVIAKELAALREKVVGEVRGGSGELERFRALLRRLFVSFELAPHDGGYLLLPLMRVPRLADGRRWDFEAAGRAPLDFSDNLCSLFAA